MDGWQFALSLGVSAFCGAAVPVLCLWAGLKSEVSGIKATMNGNFKLSQEKSEGLEKAQKACQENEDKRIQDLKDRVRELEKG